MAVLNEIMLVQNAVWFGRAHILFGYLAFIVMLVFILVGECTIIFLYYQLVYEDYRWWWKSVVCSSGLGLYIFMYSMYTAIFSLKLELLSFLMYAMIATIGSVSVSLALGTIGMYFI